MTALNQYGMNLQRIMNGLSDFGMIFYQLSQ